jgi:hypothetical protein
MFPLDLFHQHVHLHYNYVTPYYPNQKWATQKVFQKTLPPARCQIHPSHCKELSLVLPPLKQYIRHSVEFHNAFPYSSLSFPMQCGREQCWIGHMWCYVFLNIGRDWLLLLDLDCSRTHQTAIQQVSTLHAAFN